VGGIQIYFSNEASAEFKRLLEDRILGEMAERYLYELTDFPPEAWGDVHRQAGSILFKSDNHVIFDIQGKACLDELGEIVGLKITRFRSRRKA
jgi:hypothetical protein